MLSIDNRDKNPMVTDDARAQIRDWLAMNPNPKVERLALGVGVVCLNPLELHLPQHGRGDLLFGRHLCWYSRRTDTEVVIYYLLTSRSCSPFQASRALSADDLEIPVTAALAAENPETRTRELYAS